MWVATLAMADIIFSVVVIATNPYFTALFNYPILVEYFVLNYFISLSTFLFVGINLDRAVLIKRHYAASKDGKYTFLKKTLACIMPSFLPPLPYLFDTTLQECRKASPEDWCWPPIDNVGYSCELFPAYSSIAGFLNVLEPVHWISVPHCYHFDCVGDHLLRASEIYGVFSTPMSELPRE